MLGRVRHSGDRIVDAVLAVGLGQANMGRTRCAVGNRRGSALAIFGAFLATGPIIAVTVLDMGTLVATRVEIQRTVDAAALAGASAFINDSGIGQQPAAEARAHHYVTANPIRGRVVHDDVVEVDLATQAVTVTAEVEVPVMLLPGARVSARAVARGDSVSVRIVR